MKKIWFRSVAVFLLASTLLFCVSCSKNEVEAKKLDFEMAEMSELRSYVTLGDYKGMTIKLDGRTKSEAVWSAIRESAEVIKYPEPLVRYYEQQAKAEYEYHAEKLGIKYKDVLEKLGTSEEEMRSDAERMAIDDVLFEIIKRTEAIVLEESEKQAYFDRYVEKYVEDYGYGEEYVRKELSDEVYDSMLYDKVCEFLITNNKFE